jgi:S-adenosylmethionine decarboxylase
VSAAAPAAAPSAAAPSAAALPGAGVEWVVEAFGADAERLASVPALAALVDTMVGALALTPVGPARWHQFPAPGGVTGLVLLAESHLALHTFPEHGSLCLNLFCCAPRPAWDFAAGLAAAVGARRVRVRRVARRYAPRPAASREAASAAAAPA